MAWPKSIPHLTAGDFNHGAWAQINGDHWSPNPDEALACDLLPKELDKHCGTQCCLVGWARYAFGRSPDPLNGPIGGQGEMFLAKFLEIAGYPASGSYDCDIEEHASNCFEGDGVREILTTKTAAKVWKKTREHFGYTEVS